MKKLLLALLFVPLVYCSSDSPIEVPPPAPVVVKYTLTASAGDGGSVSTTGGEYVSGESLNITATPNSGYVFTGWSNGSSLNPLPVTMNSNQTISAEFTLIQYQISNDIIGKWDISNSSRSLLTCKIFNIIFNQNEFTINYSAGTVSGTFQAESETEITLNSFGNITNISISDNTISFEISITGCSVSANGVLDETYEEGDCTTFLECNDGAYFNYNDSYDDILLRINNNYNLWFESWTFEDNCFYYETQFDINEGSTIELIENNKDFIIVKENNDNGMVFYFKLSVDSNGNLLEQQASALDELFSPDETYTRLNNEQIVSYMSLILATQECAVSNCIPGSILYTNQEALDFFQFIGNNNWQQFENYEFQFSNYYVLMWGGNSSYLGGTFEGINFRSVVFVSSNNFGDTSGNGKNVIFNYRIDNDELLYVQVYRRDWSEEVSDTYGRYFWHSPGLEVSYSNSESFDDLGVLLDAVTCYVLSVPEVIITPPQLTFIPDDNFEQALIDLGYDDILDDNVLTNNISNITSLDLVEKNITDLTGIEDFTSLVDLDLLRNQLSSIDISNNINLETLRVSQNQLTSIDVSNNTQLKILSLTYNLLTELDVSNNTELERLGLRSLSFVENKNRIEELDLSNNSKLETLSLDYNDIIGTIDISNLTELTYLTISGNTSLSSLDLSKNTKLIWLDIGFNPFLNSIDLSSLIDLQFLSFKASSYNFSTLDVSNNNKLVSFDATFMGDVDIADCIKVSQYQMDNQIAGSIDGLTSNFTVWYSSTSGQTFDSIDWTKDPNGSYELDCN